MNRMLFSGTTGTTGITGTIGKIILGLLAGILAAPGVSLAQAGDDSELRIGSVHADTLFVERELVIRTALERNEMLAAAGAMKDAAAADALSAWQGFLPQIQLGEFYMRSDDALMSFGFKLQNRIVTPYDFDPTLLNRPGETNNYITRLQLLQPIFNGLKGWHGKKAANAASRAAAYKHQRAGQTVRFHAVQAYEGLVLAQAYAKVLAAAVRSAEGHVNQARALVDNEMATAADLLQAQVFLSAIQQQHIEVRNMVAIAGENIKLLTAVTTDLPVAARTIISLPAELAQPDGPDLAAVADRSDLLASQEQATAAGQMVGVARGSFLPHVNLSLQRDLYSQDDLFGSDARSWTLGVYATLGLGIQNFGEIKKARAHSRAASYMADFELRQARVQATKAWLEAEAARQKMVVARSAVTAAREGLRIVTMQYREGLAGMVDLLDTQAAATMAEGNLVQARHDFQVGLANLEFAGLPPAQADSNVSLSHGAETAR